MTGVGDGVVYAAYKLYLL